MVETVLAVLFVTFAFLALFRLSTMLTGKILLEHAAMRVGLSGAAGVEPNHTLYLNDAGR